MLNAERRSNGKKPACAGAKRLLRSRKGVCLIPCIPCIPWLVTLLIVSF